MKLVTRAKLRGAAGALAVCIWAAGGLSAQAPQPPAKPGQDKPAQNQQQTPAQPKRPDGANPFPEDTNSVPVMPNGKTAAPEAVPGTGAEAPSPVLPGDDADPVRSPDDPTADTANASGDSSSSAVPMDRIAPPPDEPPADTGRKGHRKAAPPPHVETAQEDENVGSYYLDQKNWRAALSRFESAVILDPENPDVYWGLAEAQRHLGDIAKARANYQKVMEYDPDSKHAKEAKRLLKDPEMAGK